MKKTAKIDPNKCDRSPFCPPRRVCSIKAISQKRKFLKAEVPVITVDLCTGCGECVKYCPHGAIKIVKMKK
ncbi:MAG: 4Fe-4S binding protein [Clostridiales bacterium]|nr:4Fe-4S binding protein [Clostridiales bacterium]